MLFIFGSGITLFLALLILGKKPKTGADIVLFLWFIVVSLHIFLYFAYISGLSKKATFLLGVDLPIALVHGPFLFLYVRSLTINRKMNWIDFLPHFLVPLVFYLYQIPFFLLPAQEKLLFFQNVEMNGSSYERVKFFCIVISGFAYVSLSWLSLKRHRAGMKDLNWIRILIGGMCIVWITVSLLDNSHIPFLEENPLFLDNLTFGTITVFMVILGFLGIHQSSVFQSLSTSVSAGVKYSKSGLKDESAEKILFKLEEYMSREKSYLDESLSLSELSNAIQISPNNLSQVLNERLKQNFYDYVNHYRVKEFCSRIEEINSKKETILSLALSCGFSSKSTFNALFKKQTGLTPSDFIRKNSPIL